MRAKLWCIVAVIIFFLAGCTNESTDDGVTVLAVNRKTETYAVRYQFGSDLKLVSLEESPSGFCLQTAGIGDVDSQRIYLDGNLNEIRREACFTNGVSLGSMSEDCVMQWNEKTYRRFRSDERLGPARYDVEIDGRVLSPLKDLADGTIPCPRSFAVINGVPYVEIRMEVPFEDVTQWSASYLASMEQELELAFLLDCTSPPSHFCWNSTECFYVCGETLYSTNGTSIREVCNLGDMGLDMANEFQLYPLDDDRILALQSFCLIEILSGKAPEGMEKEPSAEKTLRVGFFPYGNFNWTKYSMTLWQSDIIVQSRVYSTRQQLNLAILNGEVDLVITNTAGVLQEYAGRGILFPLQNLENEVIPSLMNAGSLEDKTYFIPLEFSLIGLVMPSSTLVESDGSLGIGELLQAIDSLDNHDFYRMESKKQILDYFSLQGWDNWISYCDGTCCFTDDSFARLLEFCNRYAADETEINANLSSSGSRKPLFSPYYSVVNYISAENLLFLYETKGTGEAWSSHGLSGSLFSWPGTQHDGLTIYSDIYVAIPANGSCEIAQIAINSMLSDQVQLQERYMRFPVTETALEDMRQKAYQQQEAIIMEGLSSIDVETLDGCFLLTDSLIRSADHYSGASPAISEIISEEATAYFAGGSTLVECVARVQNRVSIYLAEQS